MNTQFPVDNFNRNVAINFYLHLHIKHIFMPLNLMNIISYKIFTVGITIV